MTIYYINLFFITILLFLSRKIKENKKILASRILIIIAFIINWLNAGLRYGVGTDFFSYLDHYENANNLNIYDNEPLYLYSIKILKNIFAENTQIMFLVTAFLILIFIYIISINRVKYYEVSIFLFITLYFYYSSLNLIRQWIAITIILLGYKFIFKRELIKYISIVIIASLIHNTAIMALIFYFFINLDIKKVKNKILIFLFSILFMSSNRLFLIVFSILEKFNLGNYYDYIDSSQLNQGSGKTYFFIALIFLVLWSLFYKKIRLNELEKNFKFKILIFICLFAFIGMKNMIFGRIQMYITPYIIFIIPDFIMSFNKKDKKIIYFFIILFGLICMTRFLNINGGEVVPYKSIVFK